MRFIDIIGKSKLIKIDFVGVTRQQQLLFTVNIENVDKWIMERLHNWTYFINRVLTYMNEIWLKTTE